MSHVYQEVFAHGPLFKWKGGDGITSKVDELQIRMQKDLTPRDPQVPCPHDSPKGTSQLLTELLWVQ